MTIKLAKIAIIAGDAELAEHVCSRLRTPGVYLPLVEAPMMRLVEYGVFEQDCVRVANTIRNLDVRTILCLKVPQEVMENLHRRMPNLELITIGAYDETQLQKLIRLQPVAIKSKNLILESPMRCIEDVFVVEGNEFDLAGVIAANLAVAHGGRTVFIDTASDDDDDFVQEHARSWSNDSFEEKQRAKGALIDFLQSRLPAGLLASRTIKSVSFITRGLPYGILPFHCPTTHFFSFPLLGLNVLAGMLKSQELFRCPITVLIDPSLVGQSEFATLHETFGKAGYFLRSALGQNATAKDASFLTSYLPSDFVFYSTHCGEVKGQRVVEQFPDRKGNLHTLCYDRVLSGFHSPTESTTDLFEITTMRSWISIDGVAWSDDGKKKEIGAGELIKDYLDYCRNIRRGRIKPDLISVTDSGTVRDSDSLAMCSLSYQPLPHVVGSGHFPVVFNNACSSWRALAIRFSCAGASVYVGTSTDILNSVGILVASRFAKESTSGRTIGSALHRSQKKLTAEFGFTPYLMNGYLYTKLGNPSLEQRDLRVQNRLADTIRALSRLPDSHGTSAAKKYLKDELRRFLNVRIRI